jgi:hypothetical protein
MPYTVNVFSGEMTQVETVADYGSIVNGVVITGDTLFTRTYATFLGCDSVVTYIVTAVSAAHEPGGNVPAVSIAPNPGSDIFQVTGLPLGTTFRILDAYGRFNARWAESLQVFIIWCRIVGAGRFLSGRMASIIVKFHLKMCLLLQAFRNRQPVFFAEPGIFPKFR